MSHEMCSQCSGCADHGNTCGGQAGAFFPELCPSSEHYVGNRRWD